MEPKTQAMDLARIVESFITELAENDFVGPCDCCGFPVPAPFMDLETNELLCRKCRIAHQNGEH